jgi:hypothetical protein
LPIQKLLLVEGVALVMMTEAEAPMVAPGAVLQEEVVLDIPEQTQPVVAKLPGEPEVVVPRAEGLAPHWPVAPARMVARLFLHRVVVVGLAITAAAVQAVAATVVVAAAAVDTAAAVAATVVAAAAAVAAAVAVAATVVVAAVRATKTRFARD